MTHVFLALACLVLLAAIAVQNFKVAPLRNETISAGLTGPYHVLLDAAYVPLAASLVFAFTTQPLMELLAIISAGALILVAVTNTAWNWVDQLTKGQHALWHSRFTILVFASALALQVCGDSGWRWWLTVANVALPGAVYAYFHFRPTVIKGVAIAASPAAEKAYVALLCLWLILW